MIIMDPGIGKRHRRRHRRGEEARSAHGVIRETASTVINVIGDQTGIPFAAFTRCPV
jgi:hypothetical protein